MLELQTIINLFFITNSWYCEWLLVSRKNDISNELKWELIKKFHINNV